MCIKNIDLDLICYGCGDEFVSADFEEITNRTHNKPSGGLWASPVNSAWGWKDWSDSEDWGDLSTSFEIIYSGNTLVIDTLFDLHHLIVQHIDNFNSFWPDFEAMKKLGIDGIFLTEKGEKETRFTEPGLYGWDCESIVVLNPEALKQKTPE